MTKAKKPRVTKASTLTAAAVEPVASAPEVAGVVTLPETPEAPEEAAKMISQTTELAQPSSLTPPKLAAKPAVSPTLVTPKPEKKIVPVERYDDLEDLEPQPGSRPPVKADGFVSLHLSRALHEKLVRTAQDEGVDLEALAVELLAEGVVLRAWEIIERKGAMRGAGNTVQNQGGPNFRPGQNNNRHGNHNNRGGGRPHNNNPNQRRGAPPNNNWMEDKAAFLEYVRNQEKRRR